VSDLIDAMDLAPDMLITVSELAKVLRISRAAAHRIVSSGELPSFRFGVRGGIRIPSSSVLEYIEASYRATASTATPPLPPAPPAPTGRTPRPTGGSPQEPLSGSKEATV
jgi:excisionase family DNA binding protein